MWVFSGAATGYILCFSIYTGKDPNVSISLNGLADDVVMRLFENKFYTSPNLFLDLFNKGVSGTETVRTNGKNFPSELREAWDKKPPRGTSIFRHYGPITDVRWFEIKMYMHCQHMKVMFLPLFVEDTKEKQPKFVVQIISS